MASQNENSSPSKETLLNYIRHYRNDLNIERIEEIANILDLPNLDINAKGVDGKTSLHLLTDGYAAFEYSQLLISRGADFTIENAAQETPLDAIIDQGYKGTLLFLFILAYHNNEVDLPAKFSDNEEIQAIESLLKFDFPEDSQCGTIFNKLKDNYFDFDCLEKDEIDFLSEMKQLNAAHSRYKDSSGSSESDNSDSEPEADPLQTFAALDLGDLEMIEVFREFLGSFATQIHNKHIIEYEKSSAAEDRSPQTSTSTNRTNQLQQEVQRAF